MSMKKFHYLLATIVLLVGLMALAKEQSILDLTWEDLVPSDYVFVNPLDELSDEEYYALADDSEKAQELMAQLKQMMDYAPVVEEYDDKTVRLSGYAVPLDFDEKNVHEFLLVPYFGACIHVPPPPGNQTVYVKSEKGLDFEGLWDAVSVVGKLKAVHVSSELAEAGYTINADEVGPYQEQVPD